jgi:hypothetical protein
MLDPSLTNHPIPSPISGRLLDHRRGDAVTLLASLLLSLSLAACATETPEPSPDGDAAPDAGVVDPGEPRTNPVSWQTGAAVLEAEDFHIEWNGVRYHGNPDDMELGGAPGTLEVRWREHGHRLRLHIHFGQDPWHWWVQALCIYNDSDAAPGICFEEPIRFRMPHGEPLPRVSLDLRRSLEHASGAVRFENMRLQPF